MQINAYLVFDGQCKEAFTFYEQVLGGKLELQTHGDSLMAEQTPPEWSDRILHARLVVDDQVLMGSDSPPEQHDTPNASYLPLGQSANTSARDAIGYAPKNTVGNVRTDSGSGTK